MATEIEPPQVRGAEAMTDNDLFGWLRNLAPAGEEARGMAKKYRELAGQAAEEQPAHPAVRESLEAMATMLESAAGLGDELWPTAQKQHAGDFDRAHNPRGGNVGVEGRADVGRAHAAGNI